MKLIIFLLFISTGVCGQNNFKVENNQVVWQKDYDTKLTKEDIRRSIQNDPLLSGIAESFAGPSHNVELNCDQTNLTGKRVQFFATVDIEESGYRVTINKIQTMLSRIDELFGDRTSRKKVPIETFQLRNGELQAYGSESRECLDKLFQKKFSFKKTED